MLDLSMVCFYVRLGEKLYLKCFVLSLELAEEKV